MIGLIVFVRVSGRVYISYRGKANVLPYRSKYLYINFIEIGAKI